MSFLPKLVIDLSAVQHNYKYLSSLTNAKVAAVVKANAYGLGADKVALTLQKVGCDDFFVIYIEEGIQLRKYVKGNIYILHGLFSAEEAKECYAYNLIPVLNNEHQIDIWNSFINLIQKKLDCVIHVDSGMNRLGVFNQSILEKKVLGNILYVMSHLSCADEPQNNYNLIQLERFKNYAKFYPNAKLSFAASKGIFLGEDYHFDLVRPGIILYGANPFVENHDVNKNIKPVVKLIAKIIQISTISNGEYIGYNALYKTNTEIKVATLSIGYADGYNNLLSNKSEVMVNGHKARILGRISMDSMVIDVSNIDNVVIGQDAELLNEYITINTLSKLINVIPYELLLSLNQKRVKKVYI